MNAKLNQLARRGGLALSLFALAVVGACGGDDGQEPSGLGGSGAPKVLEVNQTSVVVGEPLLFRASGIPLEDPSSPALVRLRFEGEFEAYSGEIETTDFEVTTEYDSTLDTGDQVLRWNRFGPFENPFSEAQNPGTFRGTVTAITTDADGNQVVGPPEEIELEVEPSIVIEELQPLVADCGEPAIRGIGGLPYEMTVRAMGFQPTAFRYEISNINGDENVTVFEHPATGFTDELGWTEPFVLNPVLEGDRYYVTTIRVIATDARGNTAETVLPYTVHRPVEVRYNGGLEVAQYYEPVPVSGCIPGQVGNRVTYSETQSETRQNSVTITVSQNWSQSNGVSNTSSWNEGYQAGQVNTTSESESLSATESENRGEAYGVSHNESASNSVGFSSNDGESWSYNVTENTTNTEGANRTTQLGADAEISGSVTASGEVGIPAVANGKVSTTVGASVGVSASQSWGSNESTSTSSGSGYSSSGSSSQSQSFGSVTSEGRSSSLTGSYSLASSSTAGRSLSNTAARSESRTYSFGEGVSESEVVSEGMSEAESRTWVESSSNSTLTSYSGFIPTGRFGVFYRQTTRLVRRAEVFTYDLCGVAEKQSEMYLNEWTWAPELAIGDDCGATLPDSQLPQAQCFIQPCFD